MLVRDEALASTSAIAMATVNLSLVNNTFYVIVVLIFVSKK